MADDGLVVFSLVEDIDGDDIGFLYTTDGTADGTEMLVDFRDMVGLLEITDFEFQLFETFADGAIFVARINDEEPGEVSIVGFSDGTQAGTVIFGPGDASPAGDPFFPAGSDIGEAAVSGEKIGYSTRPEIGPEQLVFFESGENPVVVDLDDLLPGADEVDSIFGNGSGLFAIVLNDGGSQSLHLTDGTVAGSHLIATGSFSYDTDDQDGVAWIGDTFVFVGDSETTVNAVDYTSPGTVRTITLNSVEGFTLAAVDSGVAFSGDNGAIGYEPYFWDLNSASPQLIDDLYSGNSNPDNFTDFDGGLLFTAAEIDAGAPDGSDLFFWDGATPPQKLATYDKAFASISVISDPAGPGNGTALVTADAGIPSLLSIFKTDGQTVSHFDSYLGGGGIFGSGDIGDFYLTGEVALYHVLLEDTELTPGIYATGTGVDTAPTQLLQKEGTSVFFATITPLELAVEGVTIIGTGGDDIVNLGQTVPGQPLPTDGDDIIRGKSGNDKLSGLGGDDDIKGNRGKDTLKGGEGDDALNGGNHRDKLKAGKGDDEVTGGKGRDKFIFGKNQDKNVITDFMDGKDKIDLSNFGFASKAEALSKFSEVGTPNDDQIAFAANGTEIDVHGIDLGQLGGSDLII